MTAPGGDDLLRGFPVVVSIPVQWGEMDYFRHVNNTVFFRYFESARMAYFERVGFWEHMDETGVGPILASKRCRFRLPLTYPDTVSVGAGVPEVEGDRFLMKYVVVSHSHGKAAAEGEGMIVSYDYRKLAKAPLPEVIRRRIDDLEGRSRNEL